MIAFIALPIIALVGVIATVWRSWDHRPTFPSAAPTLARCDTIATKQQFSAVTVTASAATDRVVDNHNVAQPQLRVGAVCPRPIRHGEPATVQRLVFIMYRCRLGSH
jgi:hypothetical protein